MRLRGGAVADQQEQKREERRGIAHQAGRKEEDRQMCHVQLQASPLVERRWVGWLVGRVRRTAALRRRRERV